MKLIKRIIILIIAAVLGTIVYGKYKAVENITSEVRSSEQPAGKKRPTGATPAFSGGIGPVGNPNAKKPLARPLKKAPY